uniref:hypothetical protein n=1 Tax=Shewanella woodyi TaxID=60961 RepID=UPI0035B50FBA
MLKLLSKAVEIFATLNASKNCLTYGFCREQTTLHGGMCALDLGEIQGASITAYDKSTGEAHLRQ